MTTYGAINWFEKMDLLLIREIKQDLPVVGSKQRLVVAQTLQ